jgi:hypothetical protein
MVPSPDFHLAATEILQNGAPFTAQGVLLYSCQKI